ncbi:MAG TPA: aminoacyl-tRNA hydrolase [Vicinamibacterales bacterium]|nr:aminoacyl-tRNA hydrolase [Vicinamibacterales bacterium]
MRIVVGLGNPGRRYQGTRHNIGFAVADEVARRGQAVFESGRGETLTARVGRGPAALLVVKPLTMMNLSGEAVAAVAGFYKVDPSAMLVAADDVNLPLGRLRLRAGGTAGGHNGLKSIIGCLGTEEFPRLRVGVGRGDPRRDLADHVLAVFDDDERNEVDRAIARAADAVETFLAEGIEAAMNRYNRAGEPSS